MPTATSLEEIEPQLRHLLGLVDGSEQTRRVLDYVIAYAASVHRGAVQLREKCRAAPATPKGCDAPLKRFLAVVEGGGQRNCVLDYVIGYAASVGPVEVVILDVRTNLADSPQAFAPTTPAAAVNTGAIRGASRRLNHLGIVHKTRVEFGDPASIIIRCANEEACDLIVLNDPNPGVRAGELPPQMSNSEGSVSQRVSHLARIPVVIAK